MTAISGVSGYQYLYSPQGYGPQPNSSGQPGGSTPVNDGTRPTDQSQLQAPLQARRETAQLEANNQQIMRPGQQDPMSSPVKSPQEPLSSQDDSANQPGVATQTDSSVLTPTLEFLSRNAGVATPTATLQSTKNGDLQFNMPSEDGQDMNVNEQVRDNVSRLMEFADSQARGGDPSAYNSFGNA